MQEIAMQEMSVYLKKWSDKDQSYEGEYLGDSFHGQGTYRWNKTDVYEGGFFSNHREGYAVLSFSNNSTFEGLFIKNRPFGPGILTHSNGRQDAGFWVGQQLVRLSRPVDYIVPRLAPTSAAKIKLLQFRPLITLNEKSHDSASYKLKNCGYPAVCSRLPYSNQIYDPRSIFFNNIAFEKTFFINTNNLLKNLFDSGNFEEMEDLMGRKTVEYENQKSSKKNSWQDANSHCLCHDMFVMEYREKEDSYDICSTSNTSTDIQLGLLAYYSKYGTLENMDDDEMKGKIEFSEGISTHIESEIGIDEEEMSFPTQIVSWNRSELCTEMLKQIFRHRAFEEKLNFKIAKLMLGARTEFRRTGEKEKECLQLLKMCSFGPPYVVKDLLCHYKISEELMDSRGNNSLMFAAAADQHEIIDLLLDYGVDVNTFNDESLTPLNLCLLRRLAQSNKIFNWETAFLPTEIQKNIESNLKTEELKDRESIGSLDRIFGDGMSADNKSRNSEISGCEGHTNEMGEETKPSEIFCQASVIKIKFVPKSNRREEFMQSVTQSTNDKYLFDLSPEPRPVEVAKKKDVSRSKNTKIQKEQDKLEEEEEKKEEIDPVLVEKLKQIDRTIEKLLSRGADPNISEVPKPSIHLGVFTKDVNVVNTLLRYGANPDSQMYPNEGLLTPLHVVALLKPAPESIDICQTLLNSGANLEEETSPDFCINEAEKEFLDNIQGRTPLQLLCMRPDLEYADPKGYVTEVGLKLAKLSDKSHFYKGHSFVTLAMMTGNIKLLTAFLNSGYFDPNALLGNDLGTALHVLVSTQFQKKTMYENSIKVCDLLLGANADPLKKFKTPSKLAGTCIDFGYREIEGEKAGRKAGGIDKKESKGSKQEKGGARDHLKDHIKLVEYLDKKASDLKKVMISVEQQTGSHLGKIKNQRGGNDFKKPGIDDAKRKNMEKQEKAKKENDDMNPDQNGDPETLKKENGNKSSNTTKKLGKQGKENEPQNFETNGNQEKTKKENEVRFSDQKGNVGKPRRENEPSSDPKNVDQTGTPEKSKKDNNYNINKNNKLKSLEQNKTIQSREKTERSKEHKDDRKNTESPSPAAMKRGKKKKTSDEKVHNTKESHKNAKSEILGTGKKDPCGEDRTRTVRVFKSFSSDRFPEKLRQSMLSVFGNCVTIDVNELLLPYVVLRNGDLYYRFQGQKATKKEQYSLV